MKGGGHHARWDVRRTWTCRTCQRVRKTGGDVTAVRCECPAASWMVLTDLPVCGFVDGLTSSRHESDVIPSAATPSTTPQTTTTPSEE